MDSEALQLISRQSMALALESKAQVAAEYPAVVLEAAEALLSDDVLVRQQGLDLIERSGLAANSSLIAYLLVSSISDADIPATRRIARLLAGIMQADGDTQPAPDELRARLGGWIAEMRTRPLYSLVRLAAEHPSAEEDVLGILRSAPYAGRHLLDLLSKREFPLEIRRQSVRLVGLAGYLQAIAPLERLLAKFESRLAGRSGLGYSPTSADDEAALIPEIRRALDLLKAP
mgnify:CR=1 FL=1